MPRSRRAARRPRSRSNPRVEAMAKLRRLAYRRAPEQCPDRGATTMCADWSKTAWRSRPRVQMPDYPDAAALAAVEQQARLLPAAGLRRRGAQAQGAARRGGRGPRLPAAGRRLRRELRRVLRRQHPRHLQGDAADGGGADLRRQVPGGEDRPHGRPVRQAALRADRGRSAASSCRPTAATSSTASTSRRRRGCRIRRGCCRPTPSRRRR